jgi:hypothetical protein
MMVFMIGVIKFEMGKSKKFISKPICVVEGS